MLTDSPPVSGRLADELAWLVVSAQSSDQSWSPNLLQRMPRLTKLRMKVETETRDYRSLSTAGLKHNRFKKVTRRGCGRSGHQQHLCGSCAGLSLSLAVLVPGAAGASTSTRSDIFTQMMSTRRSKTCRTLTFSLALAS